eukprot:g9505.t1
MNTKFKLHRIRCDYFFVLLVIVITLFHDNKIFVNGLCPNACSGHGFCGEFLMCFCFRNYKGADCSRRVCPYGHAFVTTPQGDLNHDGDRADNSWKRLSVPVREFKVNSNTITLGRGLRQSTEEIGATNIHRHELAPGDMIRVADQVMRVESCLDGSSLIQNATNFAYTCNKIVISWSVGLYDAGNNIANPHAGHSHSFRFGGRALQDWSGYSVYKFIQTQHRPEGTWEQWPGDFYGSGTTRGGDEGHFYMECSNRGTCHPEWGYCKCFPGYTGIACSRQTCSCNGHGTCETVDELRKMEPTLQAFSVQTYKDSKIVNAEIEVDSTYGNNKVLLRENDYIKIGTHPPMKIQSISKTVITLYATFPETLPYGTNVWKIFKYDLWDKKKNRACKCDATWTGNNCKLRKCPKGDDPLTLISYDPEKGGTRGTEATLPPHAGDKFYTGYSPYRQKAERQTLEIDSLHRPSSGTFRLTFTDEYGDEWVTRPIPLVVRLSQTLKTSISSAGATFLDFGNDPGIHQSEINLGDIIRIGHEYRLITKLEYRTDDAHVLDRSLQHYSKIHFTTGLAGSDYHGRQQQSAYAFRVQGTPVYRVTVAKEIREALIALPNDRITDVTVEAITRGGHVLDQTVTSSDNGGIDRKLTFANPLSKRQALMGDILRYGDEYRPVMSVVDDVSILIANSFGNLNNDQIFIQNGMKYDITFEQGCRSHHDCRSNGVDENDSNGPPQKKMYEGGANNAAHCHNGGTCMCSDGFHGHGCTRTGRGHHANYKVTVSGDIYNLKCGSTVKSINGVTEGLTSSAVLSLRLDDVGVARDDPQEIKLSGNTLTAGETLAPGDHVRIENQVRTVQSVALPKVWVDKPFEETSTSDNVYIFPQYTPIERVHHIGGVRSMCTVTDLRQLTSTQEICHFAEGTDRDVQACGHFHVNQLPIDHRYDQQMREVNLGFGLYAKEHSIAIPGTASLMSNKDTLVLPNEDISLIKPGMIARIILTHYSAQVNGCQNFGVVARDLIVRSVNSNTIRFTENIDQYGLTTDNIQSDNLDGNGGFGGGVKCCTGAPNVCGMVFVSPPRIMDEREVEIGDRIRLITTTGNWETRTVDSITYAGADGFMPYQISGFTVSEPYDKDTISKTVTISNCIISNDNKLTKANHGVQLSNTVQETDWVQMKCNLIFTSDGIYKIKAINNNDIEFDTNFDVPPPIATTQACTLTVFHIMYNDGAGTTEANDCSNRGVCIEKTGECECFKGFYGEDCSQAIAFAL